MELFSNSVNDGVWVTQVEQAFYRVAAVMREVKNPCVDGEPERLVRAVQGALSQLPASEAAMKGPDPSQPRAKAAKKALRNAIKDSRHAAKQGQNFIRDITGGGGERMRNETGFAQRVAGARVTFSLNGMKELAESASKKLDEASVFIGASRA